MGEKVDLLLGDINRTPHMNSNVLLNILFKLLPHISEINDNDMVFIKSDAWDDFSSVIQTAIINAYQLGFVSGNTFGYNDAVDNFCSSSDDDLYPYCDTRNIGNITVVLDKTAKINNTTEGETENGTK